MDAATSKMDAATITVICTSFLTLFGVILNYLREGRAHRWLVEQSERDQAERLRVAEELKQHTATKAAVLTAKIDENTAVNVAAIAAGEKAYTEANNLSMKIHASGLELRAPSRQSDHIQEVVEDTNKIVHDLAEPL